MSNNEINRTRRNLILATSVVGGVGVAAVAWPMLASMSPSAKARGLGAPVEVDISKLEPGAKLVVEWRGAPVWIISRTKEMLDLLSKHDDKLSDPNSEASLQPAYCKNPYRSIKPELMLAVGICTHLGCSPADRLRPGDYEADPSWGGGFYCACHGSLFDLATRVYQGSPAPTNLKIPPHKYLSDTRILIGEDDKGA